MQVYFWTPEPISSHQCWDAIREALRARNVTILSNHDKNSAHQFQTGAGNRCKISDVLSAVHGIAVDTKAHNERVDYLLSYAHIEQMPLLILCGEQTGYEAWRSRFATTRELVSEVTKEEQKAHDDAVHQFFWNVSHRQNAPETPCVKFTARLTRTQSAYLTWKAQATRQTKSLFLRRLLTDLIDNDDAYKAYRSEPPGVDKKRSNTP